MNATQLLTTIKQHGATLYLYGDRLRLRAPVGFPDELKARTKACREELIGLLRERLSPRDHLLGLADGYEDIGVVGRLGSAITGKLWLAVQEWEQAREELLPEADDLEAAYWALWGSLFPYDL